MERNKHLSEHCLHDAHGRDDQDFHRHREGGAGGHQARGRQARHQRGRPPWHRLRVDDQLLLQ